MGKYCTSGQATDDNLAHAHCMLDTKGYKHTLKICNTYCFSTGQWLQKHATVLHYTYIACLVVSLIRQCCDKIRIKEALEVHLVNKSTVDGTRKTLMNIPLKYFSLTQCIRNKMKQLSLMSMTNYSHSTIHSLHIFLIKHPCNRPSSYRYDYKLQMYICFSLL